MSGWRCLTAADDHRIPATPEMTTSAPELAICVPVYKIHPEPNLATLAADVPAALDGVQAELVVVLNGIEPERARVPDEATVLRFDENQGVPIAWNAAARAARAGVLCVINDDVRLGEGSLRMLLEALRANPDAGVVGPVGTDWDIPRGEHRAYVDLSRHAPGSVVECDVLSGFLFLTPRDVHARAGGFDEAYTPCGFEEIDYCTTVRERLGLRCLAVAGVPVEHRFGISAKRPWRRVRFQGRSERIGVIARRNRVHFLSKWGSEA
jgi:GT2 family glycosyltransferase